MKSLDEPYRDLMYMKRKQYLLDFDGLASILNSCKVHMFDAQLGKPIPDETFNALIDWLESE